MCSHPHDRRYDMNAFHSQGELHCSLLADQVLMQVVAMLHELRVEQAKIRDEVKGLQDASAPHRRWVGFVREENVLRLSHIILLQA